MQDHLGVPRRQFLTLLGGFTLLTASDLAALNSSPPASLTYGDSNGNIDWDRVREDFLFHPGLTYLNCSALGATPKPVLDRTIGYLQELEIDPARQAYNVMDHAMNGVRDQAAHFVGCDPKELIITTSTTDGMNMIAQGIGLSAGDRVLTSDQEHHGGRCCWEYYERRYGVKIDRVHLPVPAESEDQIVARFQEQFTPKTRVLSVSHITYMTGTPLPIRKLADLAHAHGALCIVDGAQGLGSMAVAVKSLGCDAYASSGHKYLLGPKGTGLLYISQKARSSIDPLFLQDGENVYTGATGVRDIAGILGLGDSIHYVSNLGLDAISQHNIPLRNLAYEAMSKLPRVRLLSPAPGPLATNVVSMSLPQITDARSFAMNLLDKHGVNIRPLEKDTFPGGLRISPHIWNDENDIDRFLAAVRKEL